MQTVTNKAVAKIAAVATGLAMVASIGFAPMANAATLTSSQIQSILSMLSAFGANSSTIANVQAALTGQPTTGGTTTGGSTSGTTSASCTFTRSLTTGDSGADVTCLQKALIANGYAIPAITAGTASYGYFGGQTKKAVIAWQKAAGVSPAFGYFGPISRAHWNLGGGSTTGTGTGTGTGSGTGTTTGAGLSVSLSATSPSNSVLVAGQAIGDLADFTFTNSSASPVSVTGLTFNRIGVSNDSTMTNVYLYNNGTRIADSAGVSNGQFSWNNTSGLFTVPANGSYTVSVRSDISSATGTAGQQIGVSLVSVATSGTLASNVSFPIMGGYQTISSATLATVSYGGNTTPGATTISPQNDYPVWQNTISVSTNPVKLTSIMFTNLGSIDGQYLTNLRLYVDGVQVGSAVPSMSNSRTVTFDLSANPVLLSTQSHVVKVLANITGGADRTVQFSVQRASDAMFVDSQLNQPVTPEYNGGTFKMVSSGVITMNSVSGTSGVSVSIDPASPNQNIAVGATNVDMANFDMLASGENVKVSDLYVYASTTASGGLQNGKIMVNGVQVGSTKNIGSSVSGDTDFSLGSSLILPAGQTTVVSVYADAKDTSGGNLANNSTVRIWLAAGSSNAQGQSSLNTTNVPGSATSGNLLTVTNSSLLATKYTGYGNQSVVPGAQNAKIGSFTLSAGSTEGVTVNTIGITIPNHSGDLTNLTLKNDATGALLGTVITTPSSSNSFAVNLDIPASQSVTVDVYANVLSNATNGDQITAEVDTTTTGSGDVTGTQATIGSAVSLQTMTVGAGSLTVTTGANNPVSTNYVAGSTMDPVGEFNFAAQNSSYTVQNLAVLVPNNAATSVTSVTLQYTDVNGATQTVSQPLQVVAGDKYATATFSGLTMYVPANDSSNVDVFVGIPTIASGATSGTPISVTLDSGVSDTYFRAVNSAGNQLTSISGNVAAGSSFYVRKSIPTFAVVPTNLTVPASGSPLYKFSITADPAGAVEWTQLTFNVSASGMKGVSGLYLTDDSTGNSLLDSTVGTTTSGTAVINLLNNNPATHPQYQQVAAGATKTYDLYGNVSGFTTGSTLTISLASDSTASSTNNTAAAMAASNNVVWSDRSANNHSITTHDWTNGYLLKNFSSSAVSYSK